MNYETVKADYKSEIPSKDRKWIEAYDRYSNSPTKENKEAFEKFLSNPSILKKIHNELVEERRVKDRDLTKKCLKINEPFKVSKEGCSSWESKGDNKIFPINYFRSKEYFQDLRLAISNGPIFWIERDDERVFVDHFSS